MLHRQHGLQRARWPARPATPARALGGHTRDPFHPLGDV